jgi:hypothetical protein
MGAMPFRRLEDRIRDLCVKAVASETEEFKLVLEQLNAALHEHTQRLRKFR